MFCVYSEFHNQNWKHKHQPTRKQVETMRRAGINGGPNFLSWFRAYVLANTDIHQDLRQLSYGLVKVRSYGRYDVNGFRFRTTQFETLRPLAATSNCGVVTRAIDSQGKETNYYGIINKILEFTFAGNKELRVVFFDCDWFDNNHGTRENQFGMVEVNHNERLRGLDTYVLAHQVEQVYYLPYPCKKLSTWWVVYKVNPRERLYTPGDDGYHDSGDTEEVYQDEELPDSFIVEPGAGLDNLVGDVADVETSTMRKRKRKQLKTTDRDVDDRDVDDHDVDEF